MNKFNQFLKKYKNEVLVGFLVFLFLLLKDLMS